MPALRAGDANCRGGVGGDGHGVLAAFARDVFELRFGRVASVRHDVFTSIRTFVPMS